MPFPPIASKDLFDLSQSVQGNNPLPADGFSVSKVPSSTGLGARSAMLGHNLGGTSTRKLVHWLVPEGPIVQMYCNPQQILYNYNKNIERQRTKGGFVIQYWGEDLTVLDITGTTGTSGIEGINVLHDIYRNEQLAFDAFALYLAAKNNQESFAGDIFGVGSALGAESGFLGALAGASQEATPRASQPNHTLASLATQVEMYWSGEVYRGFFNSFTVTERAQALGLFDYTIRFTVTQKRGFRRNFLGWHRSATSGPSNSNPEYGTPHTFSSLVDRDVVPPRRVQQTTLTEGFKQIGQAFESAGQQLASLF